MGLVYKVVLVVCLMIAESAFTILLSKEEKIRSLLAKPFKVPMANYSSGCGLRRGLGMRRGTYNRAALHDPFEEGALVLHTPPEMSAHQQLTTDR